MTKDGRGDFFAVGARSWQVLCSLGLNEAVAYLILARGSGGAVEGLTMLRLAPDF